MKMRIISIVVILLFVVMSIISPPVKSIIFTKARINECGFVFLNYDEVRWDISFPSNKYGHKFWIMNLSIGSGSSKGEGHIKITEPGQSTVIYDYPEDFSFLNITFVYSWTAKIHFSYDIFTDSYDFSIKGFGYNIDIQ
jgi:hypothetical protein